MSFINKLFGKNKVQDTQETEEAPVVPAQEEMSEDEMIAQHEREIQECLFRTFLKSEATMKYQDVSIDPRYTSESPATVGSIYSWLYPDTEDLITSMTIIGSGINGSTCDVTTLTDKDEILKTKLFPLVRDVNTGYPKTGENVSLIVRIKSREDNDSRAAFIIFLRGIPGGVDQKSWCMRVSVMVPSFGKQDDLHAASPLDKNKIKNPQCCPTIFSFLIEEVFDDTSAEMAQFESIDAETVAALNAREGLKDVYQYSICHGVFEFVSRARYIDFSKELVDESKWMDAYRILKRAFNQLLEDKNGPNSAEYPGVAGALGICLAHLGRYDEALYYLEIGSAILGKLNNDMNLCLAMLGDIRAAEVHESEYEDMRIRLQYMYSGPYDCTMSVGYVLSNLFRAPLGSLKSMVIVREDSEKVFITEPDKVWEYNFRSLLNDGTSVMIRYSPGQIEEGDYPDNSDRCMETSFVMQIRKADTGYDDGLMRVSIMMPNFINDDDKMAQTRQNIPEGITFIASRETMMFRTVGDSKAKALEAVLALEESGRYLESLHIAKYAFYRLFTRYSDLDEDSFGLMMEMAYKIGYSYMELSLPEKAAYYLGLAAQSNYANHIQEYINCMVTTNYPGLLKIIDYYIEKLQGNDSEDDLSEFQTFLYRRKAYALIEKEMFDEAEALLNELSKSRDEITRNFVQEEMEYLREVKEKKTSQEE